MPKYEYDIDIINLGMAGIKSKEIDYSILKDELNKYGKAGWELCTSIDKVSNGVTQEVIIIFKKEI